MFYFTVEGHMRSRLWNFRGANYFNNFAFLRFFPYMPLLVLTSTTPIGCGFVQQDSFIYFWPLGLGLYTSTGVQLPRYLNNKRQGGGGSDGPTKKARLH